MAEAEPQSGEDAAAKAGLETMAMVSAKDAAVTTAEAATLVSEYASSSSSSSPEVRVRIAALIERDEAIAVVSVVPVGDAGDAQAEEEESEEKVEAGAEVEEEGGLVATKLQVGAVVPAPIADHAFLSDFSSPEIRVQINASIGQDGPAAVVSIVPAVDKGELGLQAEVEMAVAMAGVASDGGAKSETATSEGLAEDDGNVDFARAMVAGVVASSGVQTLAKVNDLANDAVSDAAVALVSALLLEVTNSAVAEEHGDLAAKLVSDDESQVRKAGETLEAAEVSAEKSELSADAFTPQNGITANVQRDRDERCRSAGEVKVGLCTSVSEQGIASLELSVAEEMACGVVSTKMDFVFAAAVDGCHSEQRASAVCLDDFARRGGVTALSTDAGDDEIGTQAISAEMNTKAAKEDSNQCEIGQEAEARLESSTPAACEAETAVDDLAQSPSCGHAEALTTAAPYPVRVRLVLSGTSDTLAARACINFAVPEAERDCNAPGEAEARSELDATVEQIDESAAADFSELDAMVLIKEEKSKLEEDGNRRIEEGGGVCLPEELEVAAEAPAFAAEAVVAGDAATSGEGKVQDEVAMKAEAAGEGERKEQVEEAVMAKAEAEMEAGLETGAGDGAEETAAAVSQAEVEARPDVTTEAEGEGAPEKLPHGNAQAKSEVQTGAMAEAGAQQQQPEVLPEPSADAATSNVQEMLLNQAARKCAEHSFEEDWSEAEADMLQRRLSVQHVSSAVRDS
eukprot:5170868-Pleurochrysis_carterae.AAC.1